mgnify:FL=1
MPIGPSRPLNLTKPESIDIRQAARYFGARGEADSATLALLERCAAPLLAAATPRAVWLEADVESLAQVGILKGEDIFRHLEGCREALLLAVTLGPGADSQIRRAGVGDIAAGVAWMPSVRRWPNRPQTPPRPSCGSGPQGRTGISRAASRRAMATGPSGCSRWWRRRWIPPAESGFA